MSAADRLVGKAHDYEVLAASHSERGALVGGGEHLAAAMAFTVAAPDRRGRVLRPIVISEWRFTTRSRHSRRRRIVALERRAGYESRTSKPKLAR